MAVLPFAWFRFAFLATALRKVQFLILLGVTRKMPNIVPMLISQLLHGSSVEIRVVLSMSRFFYCEEQSLEGIICWLVTT